MATTLAILRDMLCAGSTTTGRKHGALRPQKPLRLIRDGEVGGGISYLTPTRYTVATRMILHLGGQLCEPL